MKWWLKILFCLVYTVGYFFLALFSTGGGHGNFYLLLPAMPWIFTIVPVILSGKLHNSIIRIIFIAAMILHYGLLIYLLMNYEFGTDRGWIQYPGLQLPVYWYLAGQILIWLVFFKEITKSEKAN